MRRSFVLLVVAVLFGLAVPAFAAPGGVSFHVALDAASEVPPSGTGASGSAELVINPGQRTVCVDIDADGLSSQVLAGHIHQAPAGSNGGVVVDLRVDSADYSACIEDVDRSTLVAIITNPADYYVNVHTEQVRSGEIRGQLGRS